MTAVKCCGMTRVQDALLAAELGAAAIGMVFTTRSRRQVTLARGQAMVAALPPAVAAVALFMDDDAARVREVVAAVHPAMLQFHGAESDAWCAQFGLPFLKAVAMGDGVADAAAYQAWPQAAGLLLDGHRRGGAGGGGQRFDWTQPLPALAQPVWLAGGLDADNVGAAIHALHPWAVDVASGVEDAPGIKSAQRLRDFFRAVAQADAA